MRYIFFLSTFFMSSISFSQKKLPVEIQWDPVRSTIDHPYHRDYFPLNKKQDGKTIFFLSFKGALYPDPLTLFPVYSELITINKTIADYKVTLEDQQFEVLNNIDTKKIPSLKYLTTSINIQSSVEITRGAAYLNISFIPLRKNNATGSIEKLTHFALKITPGEAKNSHHAAKSRKAFKTQSVLKSGKWIKIKIKESGIYKITYSELINLGFSNPSDVRIYGNGGGVLPLENDEPFPDDLENNAIYLDYGSDGIFNEGDYMLFYGEGPVVWDYDETNQLFYHTSHLYTDATYYFLTTGIGSKKIIPIENQAAGVATINVTTFNDYSYHEQQDTNLIKSGRELYGEHFDIITSRNFNFTFANINKSTPLFIKGNFVARSGSSSSFTVSTNGHSEIVSIDAVNTGSYETDYAKTNSMLESFNLPTQDNIEVNIEYNKPSPSAEGWLDYITLNARRHLTMSGAQMHFRDIVSTGTGNIANFLLSGANSSTRVWDITSTQNCKQINSSLTGSVLTFKLHTDILREFIAFNGSSFLTPEFVGEVANQNLHNLEYHDMIIISLTELISYSNQIAEFHRSHDGLSVALVTPEQVYNEFSSGKPDISAIRNFVKMMYNRTEGNDTLKYLLLFGDGSYMNKNSDLILTYQSENSLNPVSSTVSDDFYGLLDDEDDIANGMVDIGIGRLPVNSVEDAQAVVNKIINYYGNNSTGGWKNTITFIGDDEDGNIHMEHADTLANYVKAYYPVYNIDKIYLDAYTQESTTGGEKYPDVALAINNRIAKGTLIFNYSGHGGERGLTHEGVLGVSDILSWENQYKLPLFVTATCEFSRFDDHNLTSAGEHILLNPNGGGIALLSTTRLVFASQNLVLNQNFYKHVFSKDASENYYRMGDIMRLTKNTSGPSMNKRNFTLLGDPALKLAYTKNNAVTTTVNGINISVETDTLTALSKATVSGYVEGPESNKLSNYNGIIYPVVYDKFQTIHTLGNDGGPEFIFKIQNNILYKGKASIKNGNFSFSFIVPKDILYSYGNGKISYYFNNTEIAEDGTGYSEDVIIGGINENPGTDIDGPDIELYLNDENFINGGTTNNNPKIYANLTDSNGINTSGNGIGHDITAVLDNNPGNSIVLNDYYEADIDSYQNGKVIYPLKDLQDGAHKLKFKAWDVFNNSAEESVEFVVVESSGLVLSHVLNYPNPFTDRTAFYFEHNRPNTELNVLIQIFTVSGKLIKTLETEINTLGFRADPLVWDGLDDFGDKIGRGVYIYRIKLRSNDGDVAEKYEKLVILK